MSKYQPLTNHLRSTKEQAITLSFGELNKILGFSLPKSAWNHRPWWGNHKENPQASGWMNAGFMVEDVNLNTGTVRLLRNGKASNALRSKEGPIARYKVVSDTALTVDEQKYCDEIADRIGRLRVFLSQRSLDRQVEPTVWYDFLAGLKQIQGNASNDLSFIATLLAKRYLVLKHNVSFCAAEKAQGAPGIDIDCKTENGERVVGEIKTTVPFQASDFGAQQAVMFKKDFAKLTTADAAYKYLFVTEPAAFQVLKKPKYLRLMPGVKIVFLKTHDEYDA